LRIAIGQEPAKGYPNVSADVTVAACERESLRAALEWLYRELPAGERPHQIQTTAANLQAGDLLMATNGDEFVGVIITQVAPGRVGWLFAPMIAELPTNSTLRRAASDSLVAAGTDRLARAGVRLAQALLPLDADCGGSLEVRGFRRMTEMIRMNRSCAPHADAAPESAELEFVAYSNEQCGDFERVVGQTYEQSRDCPELDGLRTVPEILAGYRVGGAFRPDLWRLARERDEFVGCLLLAVMADERRCELQYMGVIPRARGRGLGAHLCRHAIAFASACGARELSLSVDARNAPAIRHYEAAGFREIDRRRVYICRIDPFDASA
jgi:ribosomal protein S18 acetylase RimI-like enzyme